MKSEKMKNPVIGYLLLAVNFSRSEEFHASFGNKLCYTSQRHLEKMFNWKLSKYLFFQFNRECEECSRRRFVLKYSRMFKILFDF